MLITRYISGDTRRRGVILIVVLAMLVLFTIVGISFVLVANAQEQAARIARESENMSRPQVDAETALAFVLGQILYDVSDTDNVGIYSALRGHSLARNMYGWYDAAGAINDRPYTGAGRLRRTLAFPNGSPMQAAGAIGRDDAFLMNFMYFPTDGFLRDPEFNSFRATNSFTPGATGRGTYTGGFNVPYTYPDHNNFYLALLDPVTGAIVAPSFHREYLFGRLDQTTNANWTNPEGKYLTLRPRPQDHTTAFPFPLDRFGDVKNLDGAPGGADSIWIDMGAPVMTMPDGRKFKMLVAPLILELDSRVNLNAVGNLLGLGASTVGPNGVSRSNQGWGPWEINLQRVLNYDTTEWQKLFQGSNATVATPRIRGRYDTGVANSRRPLGPPLNPSAQGNNRARAWAQVDYNGMVDTPAASKGNISSPLALATAPSPGAYFGFPTFNTTSASYSTGGALENPDHPSVQNVFFPQGPNRRLPLSDMMPLLRADGTGSYWHTSDLARLLSNNLVSDAATTTYNINGANRAVPNVVRRRNLITLHSCDLDAPGATPYIWNYQADGSSTETANAIATRYKATQAANGRWQVTGNTGIRYPDVTASRTLTPTSSEFNSLTWRYANALRRLNLNRQLTVYPAADATTGLIDTTSTQFAQAVNDRTTFAREIFDMLRQVTGAADAATAAGFGADEYRAVRHLAQLAVNIVDFIDNDDFSTAFNWYTPGAAGTQEYVFGIEQPRLVINESYVQLDNNLADIEKDPDNPKYRVRANGSYNVNVWVELMNPLPERTTDAAATGAIPATNYQLSDDVNARLVVNGQPAYRILLADRNIGGTIHDITNPTGEPTAAQIRATMDAWPAAAHLRVVEPMPSTNRFNFDVTTTQGGNTETSKGFYVVGPRIGFVGDNAYNDGTAFAAPDVNQPLPANYTAPNPKLPTTHYAVPDFTNKKGMTYQIPATGFTNANSAAAQPTILLQRLANPAIPLNTDKTSSLYNPFITVDWVEYLSFNDLDSDGNAAVDANGTVNDGRVYNQVYDGDNGAQPAPKAMADRIASGRMQPYAGVKAQHRRQTVNPANDQPKNSFFRQNSAAATKAALDAVNPSTAADATLTLPFDWLTHLDRSLISPIELLFVSDCKPATLTQFFIDAGGTRHAHVAPWANSNARLYRFLEFVQAGVGRTQGVMAGGRVPGRININMLWHGHTLQALADAYPANTGPNSFTTANVETIMGNLITSRSPGSVYNATTGHTTITLRPTDASLATLAGFPAPDKPFWSLAMGDATGGDALGTAARGLDNTLMRSTGGLFNVPGATHPYKQKELLTKIFNSVTTRSNVFAVWLTVGFFEVTDDTSRPVKLGAEIGKAENRHIRHRMFAIVDRTNLTAFSTTVREATAAGANTLSVKLTATSGTDARTGRAWSISQGTLITFSPNTVNEETVAVQAGGTVNLTRVHPVGSPVICRGNPGPWPRYDPRLDTDVVPFFALID